MFEKIFFYYSPSVFLCELTQYSRLNNLGVVFFFFFLTFKYITLCSNNNMYVKIVAALFALANVASATLTVSYVGKMLSAEQQFEAFKFKFNKVYVTEDEHQARFENFKVSLQRIEDGNADRRSRGKDETLGVTKFADLTVQEFKEKFLTLKTRSVEEVENTPELNKTACPACNMFPEIESFSGDSFDWTTKGAVTPVKDQGQCGSCWAFGTTGDIEGVTFLSTGSLTSLSEQELVSCDKGENEGCNGGLQEDAFVYVEKNGLTTEKDYKYTSGGGNDGKCKQKDIIKPLTFIKGWTQVSKSKKGEADIKTALPKNGPITIGIDATPMQLYTGGIDSPRCGSDCGCSANDLDHAVLVRRTRPLFSFKQFSHSLTTHSLLSTVLQRPRSIPTHRWSDTVPPTRSSTGRSR